MSRNVAGQQSSKSKFITGFGYFTPWVRLTFEVKFSRQNEYLSKRENSYESLEMRTFLDLVISEGTH